MALLRHKDSMGIFDFIKQTKDGSISPDNILDTKSALMTLEDVVAPSAVSVNPRSINISGQSARVFFAVSYPRYLNDGWLEPVLNLEREMDISIMVHPIDTAETLKKFQKKVAEVKFCSLKVSNSCF